MIVFQFKVSFRGKVIKQLSKNSAEPILKNLIKFDNLRS